MNTEINTASPIIAANLAHLAWNTGAHYSDHGQRLVCFEVLPRVVWLFDLDRGLEYVYTDCDLSKVNIMHRYNDVSQNVLVEGVNTDWQLRRQLEDMANVIGKDMSIGSGLKKKPAALGYRPTNRLDALCEILMGEKVPYAIKDHMSGDTIIPANVKVTRSRLRRLIALRAEHVYFADAEGHDAPVHANSKLFNILDTFPAAE
tara:strand:+ start:191 stop:799 length:609 start_codon:yes stop_codon:yes gene_type:complete